MWNDSCTTCLYAIRPRQSGRGRCCSSGRSYGFLKEASTCRIEVEYGIRKAPDEILAKTRLIMLRKHLRMLLNTGHRTLDLPLQVSAEPRALLLIVRNCCTEFRPRIGMKNDRLHEPCARNSSNTWAAGIPTTLPLCISATRRANSASHAASTSVSASCSSEQSRKWAS